VGRFGLQLVVLRDLGDVSDIPVIPRLLADLERGDARVLEWFVQKRFDQMQTLSAMALVARAASGATRARWELIESQAGQSRFGRARLLVPPRIGAILGAPDLGDAFRAPVQSDVRALFVSGTLDANTPPEQAEAVRKGFPNSAHVIVENGGHEDLLDHAAVKRLVLRFLRGETVTDARVAAPPVRFVPIRGHDPRATHPAVEYARSRS
jgi:pimeloyl-ACP methyl ester carboxylesterase